MSSSYASGYARRTDHSYKRIGLETEILGARPERLISILLQAALQAIRQAHHHLQAQHTQARGNAISKAIEIVESGLMASIDSAHGGELAHSLTASYELIIQQLLLANLRNSTEHLNQAEASLTAIAHAWHQAIDPQHQGLALMLNHTDMT